jgi:hypothetical protein
MNVLAMVLGISLDIEHGIPSIGSGEASVIL